MMNSKVRSADWSPTGGQTFNRQSAKPIRFGSEAMMLERSHRALRSLMTLAIVVAVWPGIGQSTIRAQASAPLTIVLTGASKPVSAALVVDGRRQPVGISDASGRFTLDMGSLNRG